jgi:hypothetical protein
LQSRCNRTVPFPSERTTLTRSHTKPANRTPLKRLFWRVLVIVLVLIPGVEAGRFDGFAQAANPSGSRTTQEPTTVDELRSAFGVSQLHRDYVVVVDVSGSMSEEGNPPPWPVASLQLICSKAVPFAPRRTPLTRSLTTPENRTSGRLDAYAKFEQLNSLVGVGLGTPAGSLRSVSFVLVGRSDYLKASSILSPYGHFAIGERDRSARQSSRKDEGDGR